MIPNEWKNNSQTIISDIIKWLRSEPRRLSRAFGYALEGLRTTFLMQAAFRLEVIAAVILVPWVLHLHRGFGPPKKALLIGSIFLVLVIELLNTAIEAVVDRVSPENHPLAKLAKDAAAAAVMVSLLAAAFVWWIVL